jgi:hypothetical protein
MRGALVQVACLLLASNRNALTQVIGPKEIKLSWIKSADGAGWLNLDRASRAWVQPAPDRPGHFRIMAHIDGRDEQLGTETHEGQMLAEMVLKNYLS